MACGNPLPARPPTPPRRPARPTASTRRCAAPIASAASRRADEHYDPITEAGLEGPAFSCLTKIYRLCELLHIRPQDSEAVYDSPDGVRQLVALADFNIRG